MTRQILDVVALSPLQRGLYSVSTMSGDVDPYLVTFAFRIDGLTDLTTVRTAFDAVLARYPHLGGAVVVDGLPHPVLVTTTGTEIGWREIDLRDAADPAAAARALYWAEGRIRIDLDNGPLFRVTTARVGADSYEVVCTAHHIVVDGWSIPLLFADLVAIHRGAGAALPEPPQLRDHAAWLASRDTDVSIAAWTEALAGLDPMPMIATPAPADIPVLGESRLGIEETEIVAAWARRSGITLNTALQLAWARLLSGLTGRDDVVFGQATTGRDASLPDADRLVGALVTTIPVRVRTDERAPAQAGAELQREVAQLRAHEYLGIAEITRHAGVGQLFDTLLVFENTPVGDLDAAVPMGGGAQLRAHRVDSPSHYPIAVVPVLERGDLITRVEIRPDLAARFEPDRLARRVNAVLRRLVDAERCSDVDVLLDDEPAAIGASEHRSEERARSGASDGSSPIGTAAIGASEQPVPGAANVPAALFAAAAANPDGVAVVDAAGEQTFAEFASAVCTLAASLRGAGVTAGDAVAVMLPRDRRVLHAPFAIALAGGLCVHVDPATPPERLAYLLETSEAKFVLADSDGLTPDGSGLIAGIAPAPIELAGVGADLPFYVVFTSGTTGRPKGVVVPHRGLLSHWANHERKFFAPVAGELGRRLRIGHGWSTGFDAAWQPTVALLSGHAVVMLGDDTRTDAERIVAAIETHGIDIFDTSPSMLNRLIAAGLFFADASGERCPLAVLALGGEAISPDTWDRLRALPSTRVVNFYGPTEATVEALSAEVHEHRDPTIGFPFDRMTAEILDHRLRPVPTGGLGELYLGGAQLALGYLDRPGGTAGAFVASGRGRRYRTGDLVRRTTEGTVVYEGRIDSQVKINGYRVEPDEATVVLRELDGVRHAAALAFTENGRTKLGALVVAERSVADIRTELARRLPAFLVPSRIVAVEQIPLNRNDKLDGHAAVALLTAAVTGDATEPATDTERTVLGLLAEIRQADSRPGMLDSLTDLGVDSIGIIDLVSRLRGAGFAIVAADVLAAADLRDLARRIDEGGTATDAPVTPPGTLLPLTPLAREIIGHGEYRFLAQTQAIELPDSVGVDEVRNILAALAVAHPALRSRSVDGSHLLVAAELPDCVAQSDETGPAVHADTVRRLDPDAGRMVAATLLDRRLLLSIHHLAVDVVSWLVLVDDLRRLAAGETPLNETPELAVEDAAAPVVVGTPLGGRYTDPAVDRAAKSVQRVAELDVDATGRLLARCGETGVSLEDVLIVACARAFADAADDAGVVAVTRESHGRPAGDDSRRVGWFTVEETVHVGPEDDVLDRSFATRGQVRLNHLGRFDQLAFGSGPWTPVPVTEFAATFGTATHPDLPLRFTVDLNTAVVVGDDKNNTVAGPVLVGQFEFNSAVLGSTADLDARIVRWLTALSEFAAIG